MMNNRLIFSSAKLQMVGAIGMFLVTLSFLFTTPNLCEGAPFLIKDICLLGAALWTAGEALQAKDGAR